MTKRMHWTIVMMTIFQSVVICSQSFSQEAKNPDSWKAIEKERTDFYARQLEDYLLEWLVEGDTFLCILRVLCGEFAVVLVFSFVLPLCPPQSFF